MEVLRFESADGNFVIQVSSKDLTSSYRKFVSRRIADPTHYCSYESSSQGRLCLHHPLGGGLSEIPPDEWSGTWPVFYETLPYNFTISINNVKNGSRPHVVHPRKDVEDLFNSIKGRDDQNRFFLSGTINFLNEPGSFSLQFVYEDTTGNSHHESFEFDIVSPKLDTKNDLKRIVKQLRDEYNDLVFRYLTLTFQNFAEGNDVHNELIWLSSFKKIVDGYLLAVRHILNMPHNKERRREEFRRPDQIKKWTSNLAERFCEDYKQNKELALRKYYRTKTIVNTNDTKENRFVKYTLEKISERLKNVLSKAIRDDVSDNEKTALQSRLDELNFFLHNPFWRNIGRFDGMHQESIVLQQRSGYAQIYHCWILLRKGLDLIDGSSSIGIQPIWKLYELWCFLEIKQIVCDILHIDVHNPNDFQYITDKSQNTIELFNGGDLSGTLELTNKENGDVIEIGYQYTYTRNSNSDGESSLTVEQQPDIVLKIKKNNGFVLTYLFDAKYRVKTYGNENFEGPDYPEEDTLNQMHRYRDAIYYGSREKFNFSKEVIGGYILFPGALNEIGVRDGTENAPYYIKSIESVNIGAFPLLPNENSGILLKEHLRHIILDKPVYDQIKDSVPQKGLKYHVNGNGKGVALIRLKEFEENLIPFGGGEMKIAIPVKVNEAGIELIENIENLSYVLFTIQGNEELKRYFRVIDIPRILKKDSEGLNKFSLIRNTDEVKRFICVEIKETEPYNVQVPHDEQMVYIANAKKDIACYVELSP